MVEDGDAGDGTAGDGIHPRRDQRAVSRPGRGACADGRAIGQGLAEEELVRRVVVLRRIGISELVEKRPEASKIALFDFETGEDAPEVSAMIPIVEQADVPPAPELLQELDQRAGP